jgi:hypothetical protein
LLHLFGTAKAEAGDVTIRFGVNWVRSAVHGQAYKILERLSKSGLKGVYHSESLMASDIYPGDRAMRCFDSRLALTFTFPNTGLNGKQRLNGWSIATAAG